MTASAASKTKRKRDPNKDFIGGHFDKELIDAIDRVADREFRGNRTWAIQAFMEEGVALRKKARVKKICS